SLAPRPPMRPELRRFLAGACLLLGALVLLPPSAGAQVQGGSLRSEFWSTNGVVNALAISGNTLYVGGEFTHVGPVTGPGVPIDAATGLPVAGFPAVDGCIYAAVSDGAGGWFVGGSFQAIGGAPRSNLAHVLSDMSVAPWNPQPNTTVLAIALSGSTVYFGGSFSDVGGVTRRLV